MNLRGFKIKTLSSMILYLNRIALKVWLFPVFMRLHSIQTGTSNTTNVVCTKRVRV